MAVGLLVCRTPIDSKPGGLFHQTLLQAIIRPVPELSTPREVIATTLEAAAAFPARGNN